MYTNALFRIANIIGGFGPPAFDISSRALARVTGREFDDMLHAVEWETGEPPRNTPVLVKHRDDWVKAGHIEQFMARFDGEKWRHCAKGSLLPSGKKCGVVAWRRV